MQIFQRLYELRTLVDRETESVELMVGDGIVSWRTGALTICHPTLLLRLQLEFDPQIPEFTLIETEQPPDLYTPLFQGIAEVNARDLSTACRKFVPIFAAFVWPPTLH